MEAGSSDPGAARLADFRQIAAILKDSNRRIPLLSRPNLTYLFWESTLRCNLSCAHCGSECSPSRQGEELATGEIKRILNTIAEDFDTSRIFVSITGGEPLLRPDLVEVVRHMTTLGLRSCVVTNGTLLTDDLASRLVDAGMRVISVSIDGTLESHEALRGEGTYQVAMAALTKARRAGFEMVEAITCVRPSTLGVLPQVEQAVRGAGAGLWRLLTLDRMGRLAGRPRSDLWLEPAQVRRLFGFIANRRQDLARRQEPFTLQFSCGGFLGVERELRVRPQDGQCFAGLCVASILSDGAVGACPSLPRSWSQGSARTERFSWLWKHGFRAYRDPSWKRSGVCSDCSWFKVCLGGGLHERLAQPDSFCWLDRQR